VSPAGVLLFLAGDPLGSLVVLLLLPGALLVSLVRSLPRHVLSPFGKTRGAAVGVRNTTTAPPIRTDQ
jgi:hypothetical protein